MTYEEFKKELSAINLEKYDARTGLSLYGTTAGRLDGRDGRMNLQSLNPAFGYRVQETSYGVTTNWGISEMYWCVSTNEWSKGAFTFSLEITNRSWKKQTLCEQDPADWKQGYATFHRDAKHDLTDEQRAAIVTFVKKWVAEQDKANAARIARGATEPSIEDLMNECVKVANEILGKKYGDKFRARIAIGKRACDNGLPPYAALCLEHYGNELGCVGWHSGSTFTFFKDAFGINHMCHREPLCGETSMEFSWDAFRSYVNEE